MDNKNKNEELQSRREFFKSAAKAALPIIGSMVLTTLPITTQAASSGCERNCAGNCGVACTSCWTGCTGCKEACRNDCSIYCSGGCKSGCGNLPNNPGW